MSRSVPTAPRRCRLTGACEQVENILITDRTYGATVRLADFGSATTLPDGAPPGAQVLPSEVGSPYYIAPEILRVRFSVQAHDCVRSQ